MQIKITKKLLNKYRKYKQEIPLLKEELEEMQTTDAGLGNSTILNYQIWPPHAEGVVGNYISIVRECWSRGKRRWQQ